MIVSLGSKYIKEAKYFGQMFPRAAFPRVRYSPERNNQDSYDIAYHSPNEGKYNDMRANDARLLPIQKRYVDSEWRAPATANKYIVLSFDVLPYYCSIPDLMEMES